MSSAAVNDAACGEYDAAVITNDLDGLLNSAATGHDIFGDDELLAWLDLKSSSEDEAAIAILLNEDVFLPRWRATSCPTMMPPTAGETTVAAGKGRS